eukprot:10390001-Prorocentrum_lima.AAC.1
MPVADSLYQMPLFASPRFVLLPFSYFAMSPSNMFVALLSMSWGASTKFLSLYLVLGPMSLPAAVP